MSKIIKTTHLVSNNGLFIIKNYYDDGKVRSYIHIGNKIKFIEESLIEIEKLNKIKNKSKN